MAAQVGVSLVPESVEGVRVKGVVYRRLPEPAATSPIIMSRRLHGAATAAFCAIAREMIVPAG